MSGDIARSGWAAPYWLALKESREGFKGFRVFMLALIFGVAAIAAIGSLSAAFMAGLEAEKQRLLGGDIEVTAVNSELASDARTFLENAGAVSEVVEAQLMAHAADKEGRSVIQLKGVDSAYPLIGSVKLLPSTDDFAQMLTPEALDDEKRHGAVADPMLFDRLGLQVGDTITIGGATFELRATINSEPDRASAGFLLGPRVITTLEGAQATGLLETSAMVNHSYRVALQESDAEAFETALAETFPTGGWRIRTATEASQGLGRLLGNLDIFLTMIGLGALVIGGVGAANAVRAYMERKTPTIATLKCIGARGDFILKTYMIQILMVAFVAIAIGLIIGATTPAVIAGFFGPMLPFEAAVGIHLRALAEAAAFGLIAAAAFAFWPLAAARQASAASLFRSLVESKRVRPARRDIAITTGLALAFLGLAVALSGDREFALIFTGLGLVAYAVLRCIALGLVFLARRYWRPKTPMTRLAAASLTRPGASTASVSVSLGLGLTLLSVVSLIDANLSREISSALPQRAPALFFSDIPYKDANRFDERMKVLAKDAAVERFYMMRAGVVRLNGKLLSEVEGAERSTWARDNDWGVTILDEIPEEMGKISDGEIWPKNYAGPPRLILGERQAEQFKLKPGDTMTLNIAGREITADIAGIYDQNWARDGLNFVAVFAPGTLEAAQPTSIGSLRTGDLSIEADVARMLTQEFPEVTVIRTRDVIETVSAIVDAIGLVIRSLSGLTIAAGVIVLLGAIAADFATKLKDAMIMKTIGASRAHILTAHAIEYAILGAGPALAAVGLGLLGSWFVVARQMEIDWRPAPLLVATIVAVAVAVTMIVGLAAAARALNARPWPVLRSN